MYVDRRTAPRGGGYATAYTAVGGYATPRYSVHSCLPYRSRSRYRSCGGRSDYLARAPAARMFEHHHQAWRGIALLRRSHFRTPHAAPPHHAPPASTPAP